MRLIISFAALLASVVLLQLSSGGVGPLDVLSGVASGFTPTQVGTLGSAHFFGFFIGCWFAPRIMGNVGHSRAFATFAALGAIGILSHMLWVNPVAWAAMRVMSGLCIAGCYTVIEAWLQAKTDNETRGRTMGAYRIVDIGGSLAAQLMIGVLEPASYVSYNLLAILCCASLLPLALSRSEQPETDAAPRLRPLKAWGLSPLGVAGVVTSGVTSASFRMVGPYYGLEVGLEADQIALFLDAFVAGGALAQYPVGWAADKWDRRTVLVVLSLLANLACVVTVLASGMGISAVFGAAIFFGLVTMPIFSVSAAHAADFAKPSEMVELSAALMFFYAVGAIASPLVTSALIGAYGPGALFAFIAGAHVLLVAFSVVRMRARPARISTAYAYVPRTSFWIGRLLDGRRGRHGQNDG